ncbi:unnamed protein product [Parnassius apollo]|uniref:(apollo) hypothetical protein n=1 Tax=Parnassius apollo TaxID=110799 RepID=A0A8S3WG67_PARAO|nr:unnamed protein product [Parnassius apollo]
MAEEQACLVSARSDSESSSKLGSFGSISRTMTYTEDRLTGTEGAGEPGNVANTTVNPPEQIPDGNESGELLDYNDSSVLEQFHEDALRQAGCGLSQARVLLAVTLAIAGTSLELSAIPFVLPSAEIELCILPHEKNWLVLISLVGGSLGAVGWGALGERLGRRRTLLSCLAVNAVFAAIAAFMPTYGTFMMARFCSAIGSGGTAAVGYTYCGEWCGRTWRRRALALLAGGAGAGALLAAALADAALPDTGAAALKENKEHFSAWHRYCCSLLLLMLSAGGAGAGALLAAALADAALPDTGAAALKENKEHFSAWHRYCCSLLLLMLSAGGAGAGALLAAALADAALPDTGAAALKENKEHFSAWHRYCCSLLLLMLSAGGAGADALPAAALADAVMPDTGAAALKENKEHFSAWHRYLLLCTLPILASLVSLIWTQESPRYLLDVGREVDAMMVYQNIHSSNQIRICGKTNVAAAGGDSEYRLGELSLPGKRRPPALHHVRHSVKMFWQAFFQLFSSPYRSTTISLGGILLFSMAIQYYLSSYVPAMVLITDSEEFEASKRLVVNESFVNEHYNETLENVQYVEVAFRDCTFRDMIISHVEFDNCTFTNVSFSNIMSSYTIFKECVFVNSTIIDTDMEVGRELVGCGLSGSVVRGIRGGCARRADLRSRLAGLRAEQAHAARAALLSAAAALLPYPKRLRLRPAGTYAHRTPHHTHLSALATGWAARRASACRARRAAGRRRRAAALPQAPASPPRRYVCTPHTRTTHTHLRLRLAGLRAEQAHAARAALLAASAPLLAAAAALLPYPKRLRLRPAGTYAHRTPAPHTLICARDWLSCAPSRRMSRAPAPKRRIPRAPRCCPTTRACASVPPVLFLCAACILLSPTLYLARDETMLYIVEAAFRFFLTLIFYNVGLDVVDSYPANLRCTAHGLILSVAYMGGAVVKGMGELGDILSCVLCGLFAIAATALSLYKR